MVQKCSPEPGVQIPLDEALIAAPLGTGIWMPVSHAIRKLSAHYLAEDSLFQINLTLTPKS